MRRLCALIEIAASTLQGAYGFAGRTTAAQDRRSLLLTRWSDADRR